MKRGRRLQKYRLFIGIKNRSNATSSNDEFAAHLSLLRVVPICPRWIVCFSGWRLSRSPLPQCLNTHPSLMSPAFNPTLGSCNTFASPGEGTIKGRAQDAAGRLQQRRGVKPSVPESQTGLGQADFQGWPTGAPPRLFLTQNSPFWFYTNLLSSIVPNSDPMSAGRDDPLPWQRIPESAMGDHKVFSNRETSR